MYEILIFSATTGLLELLGEGTPLSANIVAVPKERLTELLGQA